MNWPPDIADELPARRDDEPSSLRQDIADELADHLQSSFVRELHRTPEETSAKSNVLDRFGDPRRVARQLWFDAMKEKIMSQRLLITALLVTAVACLGSTGLTFMLVEQSRQASQALVDQVEQSRKANEAFLKESRTANAAMIEKLVAISTPLGGREAGPATSMEWNPIKIRLVKDKAGGAPAEGYEVVLEGHVLDTANKNSITRKTGVDGLADLGVVRPGQHALSITTPWKESHHKGIMVLPGQPLTEEIVCPAADRQEAPVSFTVDWPDDLLPRGLWTVCLAVHGNRQIDGQPWVPAWGPNYRLLILNAENELFSLSSDYGYSSQVNPFYFLGERPSESPGLYCDNQLVMQWIFSARSDGNSAMPAVIAPVAARPFRPYHFQFPNSPTQPEENLPAGRYTLENILVAEGPSEETSNGWRKIDVLGGVLTNGGVGLPVTGQQGQIQGQGQGQGQDQFQHPFDHWPLDRRTGRTRVSEIPSFEIEPGKPNQIKIPIPPKLAENVRKFLEESK